jgi:tripartite-type tricarboxylate transporter receptor subunit TctC
MKRHRWTKWLVIFFVPVVVSILASDPGWAQYPDKPITFIMPWPAGGGTDISLRPLTIAASKNLGQPIVMEYHPGGSSAVGLGILKSKRPDGYTIGMSTASALVSQHMRKVPYNFMKDFTIIMQYADYISGFVVRADSPWETFKEFIEYAKANPGKLRFSSAGPGGPQHLAFANVAAKEKANIIHIPFEGGPPALAALLGGHVEGYTTTMQCKPHLTAGRLRLLATYGEQRNPAFPNVPTLTELGYEDIYSNSLVIIGPKNLSPGIVETLHQAFKKGLSDPEFVKSCSIVDHVIIYRNPQDATRHYQKLYDEYGKLVRDLKLQKE